MYVSLQVSRRFKTSNTGISCLKTSSDLSAVVRNNQGGEDDILYWRKEISVFLLARIGEIPGATPYTTGGGDGLSVTGAGLGWDLRK